MKNKCIVMLSGGLDSRLAVKIMQEQGFEVTALFFNIPFGSGCCDENCSFNFSQLQGVKLEIVDCSKGKLLKDYLKLLREPKYKRGSGVNPCIDCRIFMFREAKKYADKKKIELIVTGEVLGERPMSQMRKAMDIIEEEAGLQGRMLRPLSAKLLKPTEAEKKGVVDRDKLYDISGRRRERQMALAKKFKISYPHPAGGCLLCEKELINRFRVLLKRDLGKSEVNFVSVGRHFIIDDCWIVIGRDKKENEIIETLGNIGKKEMIVPDFPAPSVVMIDKCKKETLEKIDKLITAYSKKGSLKARKKFEKYKL